MNVCILKEERRSITIISPELWKKFILENSCNKLICVENRLKYFYYTGRYFLT